MFAVLGFKAGKAGFCSQVVVGQKGRELWAQQKARDRGQAWAGAGQRAETQVGPRSLSSIELPALLENRHGHTCQMQGALQGSTDDGCLTHCRGRRDAFWEMETSLEGLKAEQEDIEG